MYKVCIPVLLCVLWRRQSVSSSQMLLIYCHRKEYTFNFVNWRKVFF